MRKRPQIGNVGTIGYDIAIDEVNQSLQAGKDKVGGPQVPLLGHWDYRANFLKWQKISLKIVMFSVVGEEIHL